MLTVNITKSDVETGEARNPDYCALSLACKRVLGKDVKIGVYYLHLDGQQFPLTEEAKNFVYNFDNKIAITPGEICITREVIKEN
jgi:hypothetical protein